MAVTLNPQIIESAKQRVIGDLRKGKCPNRQDMVALASCGDILPTDAAQEILDQLEGDWRLPMTYRMMCRLLSTVRW